MMLIRSFSLPLIWLLFLFVIEPPAVAQYVSTRHVRQSVANRQAQFLNPLPANQSLRIHITLPLRNQAGLDRFLQELYDPSSPSYRRFLTPSEFAAQYGPSERDYQALVSYTKAYGFTLAGGSREGIDLLIEGTAASVESAFHVLMGLYRDPAEGRIFYAPDREPTVGLPFPLWHVSGLDNASGVHPMLVKKTVYAAALGVDPGTVAPLASTGSGPSASFLGSDMRAAYYGGTALTGAGQNLGLLEFYGTDLADLNTYFKNAGQINAVPITLLSTDGTSTICLYSAGCDDSEQTLDMTQALGMAPGLSSLVVYVGTTDTAILSAMTTHSPLPTTIGCSWGWTPADPTTLNPYFQRMAAQGQTFFVASGDDSTWTRTGNAEAWPADSQYVVSVGGTDLATASAGGAWSAETAWVDSGGGISPDQIPIPSWQQTSGVINKSNKGSSVWRNGPDVAANANFTFYVCANQTACTANDTGGTSFAAPMWAGYMALINQQAIANGRTALGFINTAIYSLALGTGYGTAFHDISSGTSGSYPATSGFDLVTGWGSPNGTGLINALAGIPTPADFTLSLSSSSISAVQGASASLTVTTAVSGGFNSAIALNLTGLPSGVVATFSPASIAAPGSGSSTLMLTVAASVAAGSYTLTAGGTGGGTQHTTSLTLTVTAPIVSIPPTSDSVLPVSGSGTPQTFTFKYSSVNGYVFLNRTFGLINSTLSGAGACFFQFYEPSGTLYLYNDAGTGTAGLLTPGQASTIGNSQCSISGAGFTATGSGNQLTLAIPISFTSTFPGPKTIYGDATDRNNLDSTWQQLGSWTPANPAATAPTVTSVAPNSGSGVTQIFTFRYSSVNGYAYLGRLFGLINNTLTATGACFFQYYEPNGTLYLYNDAGSAVAGNLTAGQAGTINNSQCTISGANFTATGSGTQLTLAIPITFSGSFTGPKIVYGDATDQNNLDSMWQQLGTWTTTNATATAPTVNSVSPTSGTGLTQTFTLKYSSVNGYSFLGRNFGLINSSLSPAGACFFQYYEPAGTLYLYNEAGTAVAGTLTPGQAGTIQNSQCTISGASFTATGNGNQLILAIPITFSNTFTGAKTVYGDAVDQNNLDSSWQMLGTWTP